MSAFRSCDFALNCAFLNKTMKIVWFKSAFEKNYGLSVSNKRVQFENVKYIYMYNTGQTTYLKSLN